MKLKILQNGLLNPHQTFCNYNDLTFHSPRHLRIYYLETRDQFIPKRRECAGGRDRTGDHTSGRPLLSRITQMGHPGPCASEWVFPFKHYTGYSLYLDQFHHFLWTRRAWRTLFLLPTWIERLTMDSKCREHRRGSHHCHCSARTLG